MVKHLILFATITSLLMMGMTYAIPAIAEQGNAKVIVHVDGLSCPFCSFGLEKKLKRLSGVETVTIKVDEGVAELFFVPGATIDPGKIREAVIAGGFTPRDIRVLEAQTETPVQP